MKSLAVFFAVLAVISCSTQQNDSSNGANSQSASSSGTNSTNVAVVTGNSTIAALPSFKPNLPASLGGDDLKLKLKLKLKSPPRRAPGDVYTFNTTNFNDVRSTGWKTMVDSILATNEVQYLLDSIKLYALSNEITYNTILYLTNIPLPYGDNEALIPVDMGQLTMSYHGGNTNSIDVYWVVDYYPFYINISNDSQGKKIVTLIDRYDDTNYGYTWVNYSRWNESDNSTAELIYEDYGGYIYYLMNSATYDNNGAITLLTKDVNWTEDGATNITTAWGNDTIGGLITLNKYYGQDNQYNYTNIEQISKEYYNQSGNLVFQSSGMNIMDDTSWYDYYLIANYGGVDLAYFGYTNAPDSVKRIGNYAIDSILTDVIDVSTTNYTTNYNYDSYWFLVQKADGSWSDTNFESSADGWSLDNLTFQNDIYEYYSAPGDAFYSYESWEYDAINDIYTDNYVSYYKVPSAQNYLTGSYYLNNTWPLKYLTPDATHSNMALVALEGSNSWNYVDTNVDDWTGATNIRSYSWQDFSWWLEKGANHTPDKVSNDILLKNINSQEFYFWDNNYLDYFTQNAWVVQDTDPTPAYFSFSQQNNVNAVDQQISNVWAADASFDVVAWINANVPAFPDLTNFPNYQTTLQAPHRAPTRHQAPVKAHPRQQVRKR